MRALGRGERLLCWVQPPRGMHVIGRAVLRGALDVERMRRALDAVRARHPVLGCAIGGSEMEPRFEPLPPGTPVPLEVQRRTAADHGLRLVSEWLADESALPQLWRCALLRSDTDGEHELVLSMHHAAADGRSVFRLFAELLQVYEAPEAALPPAPMHASVEERLQKSFPWWLRLVIFVRSFLHAGATRKRPARTLVGKLSDGPRASLIREVTLPRAEVDRLRQRCREAGASMQSLYSSAMLTLARELLPEGELSCGFSVDIRHFCGLPQDAFGVYIANLETRHTGARSLWELAREWKAQAQALVERLLPVGAIQLISLFVRDPLRLRAELEKHAGRMQTAFVTNLGLLPSQPKTAPLRIERASAYVAQHRFGASLWLGTATLESFATFSFVLTSPMFDDAAADDLVARFIALLRAEAASDLGSMRADDAGAGSAVGEADEARPEARAVGVG